MLIDRAFYRGSMQAQAADEPQGTTDLRGTRFNVRNVPALLAHRKSDPWAGYGAVRQRITAAQRKAVGA
jgi:DNA primase